MSQETRWFENQLTDEAKEERNFLRKAIAILGAACFLILLLIAVAWPIRANAGPVLQTSQDGVTVQLWDDQCALTNLIKNLPYKATWLEKGKVVEGCWGGRPDAGVVVMYFADKTMGIAPIQDFTRITGV